MIRPPRYYIYLDAVARHGSIRKAAAAIGVSSTSINRKILEIEADLGTAIFDREPKGVILTVAGEVLIEVIRRNIADVKRANSQISKLRGLTGSHVRIAIAHSLADAVIPQLIADYQRRHPRVNFEVLIGTTNDLIDALKRDEVDLAFAHDPEDDGLRKLASYRQPLCAMMRPDHPLARKSNLRLADCAQYPIALGPVTSGGRKLIDQIVARQKLSLNVVLTSSDIHAKIVFSHHADAICFQFSIGITQEVANGRMIALPLKDQEASRGRLVLAHSLERTPPVAALSFVEAIKQQMHVLDLKSVLN